MAASLAASGASLKALAISLPTSARFLAVYGGAGLVANSAQLATNAYANMRRDPHFRTRSPRCLGASGAVNAAVAYGCLLNPWRMIIVFAEFLPLRRRPASFRLQPASVATVAAMACWWNFHLHAID